MPHDSLESDRAVIRLATKAKCSPLRARLKDCIAGGDGDCAREKWMLKQCTLILGDDMGAKKPWKNRPSGKRERGLDSEDCTAQFLAAKACFDAKGDMRRCAAQVEDYKVCKMALENRGSGGR